MNRRAVVGGILAGICATLVAAVVVPVVELGNHPPIHASTHLAASPGAPRSESLGMSVSSCESLAPTLTDETSALIAWINKFPSNSNIVFPYEGCYRVDHSLRLVQLTGDTINGNGTTMVQVLPEEGGGTDLAECGPNFRLEPIAWTNVTLSSLNFVGDGDTSPITSSATATAQSGTWGTPGQLVFTATPNYGAPAPAGTHIQLGNVVNGPSLLGYWYVTGISGGNITITAGTGGANIGPGQGSVAPGDRVTFNSNTGQHCESATGLEMQGNTNVTLTGTTWTNMQGDLVSLQLPTDGFWPSTDPTKPVNTGIKIANSTFTNAGYDCISVEAAGNGTPPGGGFTVSGSTFNTCKEDMQDNEVDGGDSVFGAANNPTVYFAADSNMWYVNDSFSNWGPDFYISPNGQCAGVQKQNVTFQNDTMTNPGLGFYVQGTYPPSCLVATNHTAQSITTIAGRPALAGLDSPLTGWGMGAPITGPGISGPWTTYVIIPASHEAVLQPCPTCLGAPTAPGTYTSYPGPYPDARFLSININFIGNHMAQTCNNFDCPGFHPQFSASPNCANSGLVPPCPNTYPMHFLGINDLTMENNTYGIYYQLGYGPYQATMFMENVNGATIKNNNFPGTYGTSLFWHNNNNATNVFDCGNIGTNGTALDASC